ncbi:violacein biosynthesis enzyme VioE [Chitinimonas sp. BJB300]|uniref:violacein biosynthesis enzyme VioE n=1 Tax=Chitinimonas sp. BJB300 TaxID=1559339 RepID=UPI000C0E7903|nr:violacein biosynthesis enzyme VioE [Chitinimonas sp. BJB300]PHV13485.1 violacein biosynthesis enzyme VioE [Chitinimonas sp. BJB300]TSJ89830.1 violacein biosynthesis enzyme VioE [Chitinimonas sp. BJB300]
MHDYSPPSSPPLLPAQWSGAYISYWSPMQPDDQITSGYCWFDYTRNICRIDGLFNPWSEKETGHRLWMSEIGNAERKLSHKQKIAYSREMMDFGVALFEMPEREVTPFEQLYLPRALLQENHAVYAGNESILGQTADAWTFTKQGKDPSTYYFKAGTDLLLRMVTGDPKQHASVRDFPCIATHPIPDWIFDTGKQ